MSTHDNEGRRLEWPEALKPLRQSMAAHGVRLLRVDYEGAHNCTSLHPPQLMGRDFQDVPIHLIDDQWEPLQNGLLNLLNARFGRWGAGLGSCGTFTFDINSGTLVQLHRVRNVDYVTTRCSGFGPDWQDEIPY